MESNNRRLVKNTLFLYFRMFLMMFVTLYTSRIILQILGIQDFGIYNVVAGIVVLFAFINTAMASATQRFLSFALGQKDDIQVCRVFSMSLTTHIVIVLLVLFLAETVGLWILWNMNFPSHRLNAVFWTYQIGVLTCLLQMLRVPYNALIIAYEKMSFYAWISIFEVLLKLLIVYLLLGWDGDRLIFYSFLLFLVIFIINILYYLYSSKKFATIRYHFFWDARLFKKLLSFSGWSLFGSLANVSATQGLNMLINIFCGVAVNAAVGIANQVMGAVGQFLGNFQTAFNPQLVKSYASGKQEEFMNLIYMTSKFSFYLMLVISIPVLINCQFLLRAWLGVVPEYAAEFSQLMILFMLIEAISGPLWVSVQATGNIKNYQLLMGGLIFLNFPISLCLLFIGYSPIFVFIVRVLLNFITMIIRIIYLRKIINLSVKDFFNQVLKHILYVFVLAFPISVWLSSVFYGNWNNVLLNIIGSLLISLGIIYVLGLTSSERKLLNSVFLKYYGKIR